MFSCVHDGFCKRYCAIAEYEVSGGLLLAWLEGEENLPLCRVCPCKMCKMCVLARMFSHKITSLVYD